MVELHDLVSCVTCSVCWIDMYVFDDYNYYGRFFLRFIVEVAIPFIWHVLVSGRTDWGVLNVIVMGSCKRCFNKILSCFAKCLHHLREAFARAMIVQRIDPLFFILRTKVTENIFTRWKSENIFTRWTILISWKFHIWNFTKRCDSPSVCDCFKILLLLLLFLKCTFGRGVLGRWNKFNSLALHSDLRDNCMICWDQRISSASSTTNVQLVLVWLKLWWAL